MQAPQASNRKITVGTDAVVVAAQMDAAQRTFISITNTSTGGQNITIADGQEAKAGEGFFMAPGGFFIDSADSIVLPSQQQFTAISSAAGGTLAIMERTIPRLL